MIDILHSTNSQMQMPLREGSFIIIFFNSFYFSLISKINGYVSLVVVPNGTIHMVTHNIPENAQNGRMISATDKKPFQENMQHQPSGTCNHSNHVIPYDHPIQSTVGNNNNNSKNNNRKKIALVENLVGK